MKEIENNVFEIEKVDIKQKFAERLSNTNKGDYGYVGIMGGCLEYSGAIKLANLSLSALRAGCGVVRIIIPKGIAKIVAPYIVEQTLYTIDDENDKMIFHEQQIKDSLDKIKALAIGMGWGKSDQYEKILSYILQEYSIPIVIDADGLNTLARMNKDIIKHTNCKVILTPHVKEFERLSKINIEDIKDNTIAIAKEFAKREQVILLLKGPTTIVTDGEIVYLVKRGCPGMATAGSGDILSGLIVGLLGFQKPDTFTVATAAYINGLSGEIAQERYTDISMIASDTVRCIPDAIKKIRE